MEETKAILELKRIQYRIAKQHLMENEEYRRLYFPDEPPLALVDEPTKVTAELMGELASGLVDGRITDVDDDTGS